MIKKAFAFWGIEGTIVFLVWFGTPLFLIILALFLFSKIK
jgi:hypothetical protein